MDDSQLVLTVLDALLTDAGYAVETTDQPLTVPSTIRRLRPDVVLLDVSMPVLDGDRVLQVMRSFGNDERTQVVLHSDRPAAELEALAKRCGANGFLVKAITGDRATLFERLDHFVARARLKVGS